MSSFLDKLQGRKKRDQSKDTRREPPQPTPTTATTPTDPLAAAQLLAEEHAQAKGPKKQATKKRQPDVVNLDSPPKKKAKEGNEAEEEEEEDEKANALASLSGYVTDRYHQTVLKHTPLEILEGLPSLVAKIGLAAARAKEAIAEAREREQDVSEWTQKAEEYEKRANKAEEQNKQLGEEKNALEERLKELQENEKRWEAERVDTARCLKEERTKARASEKEVDALKDQINREREENGRLMEEAKREARAEGVAEAGDKFLYITHIHYPNPRCPNFNFKIYGEAGVAAWEELAADEDVKKDRDFIQSRYDRGVILPTLLSEEPEAEGEDAEEVAALNEAQRLANLPDQGGDNSANQEQRAAE